MADINSLGTELFPLYSCSLRVLLCSLEIDSAARSLSPAVLGSAKWAWKHEKLNPFPFFPWGVCHITFVSEWHWSSRGNKAGSCHHLHEVAYFEWTKTLMNVESLFENSRWKQVGDLRTLLSLFILLLYIRSFMIFWLKGLHRVAWIVLLDNIDH